MIKLSQYMMVNLVIYLDLMLKDRIMEILMVLYVTKDLKVMIHFKIMNQLLHLC